MQSLDESVANYDPTIFYGVESSPSVSQYGATSKTVNVEVSVIIADSQDKNIYKRLFRYQRAIEEVINENYVQLKLGSKFKIMSLEPIGFKVNNSTSEFKAIGVIIEAEIFT